MSRTWDFLIKILIFSSVLYWIILVIVEPTSRNYYDVFGILLTVLPLVAATYGFKKQREWGGLSSFVGKSIFFTSISLFCWSLGQLAYVFLSFGEEIPYPGIPDYFYILIDPFYALALLAIMSYAGVKRNLKNSFAYLFILVVPIISLYINYVIFFGDTSYFEVFDSTVVFDLFYSFGSIALMSLTILTFVLSFNRLGGKMQSAIYFLFAGFVIQYIGDIAFSILEAQDLSYNGNFSDFVYFISISAVTLGLTQLNTARFNEITGEKNE